MQNAIVNKWLRDFLATIDTAFLATASADGQPYVQHRGGPKGFIRAVDDHTLGFVDFTGNRQYISTDNLAENDKVCLFLIDFARRRRVKVWGTARMIDVGDDQRICKITVTRWDVNCPKHINPEVVLPMEGL
jgi:predicted pyridoxine 5'-phosphate oxidase superfamily flavin-nucleotide-binding protein